MGKSKKDIYKNYEKKCKDYEKQCLAFIKAYDAWMTGDQNDKGLEKLLELNKALVTAQDLLGSSHLTLEEEAGLSGDEKKELGQKITALFLQYKIPIPNISVKGKMELDLYRKVLKKYGELEKYRYELDSYEKQCVDFIKNYVAWRQGHSEGTKGLDKSFSIVQVLLAANKELLKHQERLLGGLLVELADANLSDGEKKQIKGDLHAVIAKYQGVIPQFPIKEGMTLDRYVDILINKEGFSTSFEKDLKSLLRRESTLPRYAGTSADFFGKEEEKKDQAPRKGGSPRMKE